jgi:hypothetical protein
MLLLSGDNMVGNVSPNLGSRCFLSDDYLKENVNAKLRLRYFRFFRPMGITTEGKSMREISEVVDWDIAQMCLLRHVREQRL